MHVRRFVVLFAVTFTGCSASDQLLRHPTPYARESVDCVAPIACEAHDRNALAVNLVHFRAEEARRAQSEGRPVDCQTAARAAVAVARGLFETRRYEHSRGVPAAVYRTRFAGDVPERAALQGVLRDANAAFATYRACGGPQPIAITPKEEYALFGGSPQSKEANHRFWTNFGHAAAASAAGGNNEDGSTEEAVGEPEAPAQGGESGSGSSSSTPSASCSPDGSPTGSSSSCCSGKTHSDISVSDTGVKTSHGLLCGP